MAVTAEPLHLFCHPRAYQARQIEVGPVTAQCDVVSSSLYITLLVSIQDSLFKCLYR